MKLPFQPKNSEIIADLSFNIRTAFECSEVSNEFSRPTIVSVAINLVEETRQKSGLCFLKQRIFIGNSLLLSSKQDLNIFYGITFYKKIG